MGEGKILPCRGPDFHQGLEPMNPTIPHPRAIALAVSLIYALLLGLNL